jgi:membrane-bound metal-dependent hydrolase YbcI (DUF457 family)
MLALNHAQLAVTVTLGYSLYYNQPFYFPLIIFLIFASILPDIDHPGSELGKYFKPVGMLLPHRGVTHSILGTLVVVGLMNYILKLNNVYTMVLVIAGLFGWNICKKIFEQHILSIDEKTRGLVSHKQTVVMFQVFSFIINFLLLISLALIWKKQYSEQILTLVTWGYVAHILGDFVTIEGVPLFWPIRKKFGLKLFRTGGAIESLIGFFLFFINIYLIYLYGEQFKIWTPQYWLEPLWLL